jgi:uncharacterized membrane protein
MKLLFSLLLSLLFFVFPQSSFAQEDWVITSFKSDITIPKDGVVKVEEKVDVDFGLSQKHGIYRDIPVIYSGDDTNVYTEVEVQSVLQDNESATYKLLHENENYVRIRIGDPDKYITDKHTYVITYTAKGVLRSFEEHDELYWNVTGNYWEAPIQKVEAIVTLPEEKLQKAACFSGVVGSQENCIFSTSSASANFSHTTVLPPGEGLTVVVGYQKGMVPIVTIPKPKSFGEKLMSVESGMLFVFTLLAGIVGVVLVWWRNGRDFWFSKRQLFDPDAKEQVRPIVGAYEPVIVEYSPPENLRPAEIGVLMDERADTLDVTATIIDLATRGYLTIREIPKKWLFGKVDYEFESTKKIESDLISYEKELLDHLFESRSKVKVSDLKTTFYQELSQVKTKLYEDIMAKNLFAANPDTTRTKYLAAGIVILVFAGILSITGVSNENAYMTSAGGGFITAGVLLMIVSQSMPRRSAHGREIYRRVQGYKMFIERVEKYRQPFFEKKNLFTEVLPYAIVFGIAEKFAQQLKDMGVKMDNPTWYHSSTHFNPVLFSSHVNNFSTSVGAAIASAPQSSGFSGGSGGGSSGGGFGGGGGGSW